MSKIISHSDIVTGYVGLVIILGAAGIGLNASSRLSPQQSVSSAPTALRQPSTQSYATDQKQFTTPVTQQVRDAIAQRYSQCVFGNMRAHDEAIAADNERFRNSIEGLNNQDLDMIMSRMPPPPSPAQAAYALQQNLLRIKEMCRLSYPCASDEMVAHDYDRCIRN